MNSHNAYPDEDPLPSGRPDSGSADSAQGTSGDEAVSDGAAPVDDGAAPARDSSYAAQDSPPTGPSTESGPPAYPGASSESGPAADGPLPAPPLYPNAQFPNAQSANAPHGHPQSQPQNFFNWVRGHGIQRGPDRWIGGVASGIAHRLGVDPLIVRGVFIVLSIFAGIGVLLYGVAWALLPEPDGRIHVQEAGAGRWSTGMTGALITTVIGFPSLGGGFWGWERNGFGGFLWTVFWIAGAIYLIYYISQRDKTRNGAPIMNTSAAAGGTAFAATSPTGTPSPASGAPYAAGVYASDSYDGGTSGSRGYGPYADPGTPSPGNFGPSGPNPPYGPNQPYGGGYGGPSAPAPKAPNIGPGAPAVAVTAGLALLVGGAIKALEALDITNLGNATNAVVWASGAAVLGLGILIAGLRGRTSGVLGFFAVVALIIGGIFNVVPDGDRFRFQNANWNPVSIEQAREGFDITGGTGTADLTLLNLTPPLGTDVVIPMDVTASNLTVIIPDTVPVEIRADMTMGNLNDGSHNHGGMTNQQSNYNTDKPGAALVLEIDGTMSNVTIQEGN
ncbi:PspC domain-containing protein [Arthrobacter oryzae]|uniref:PspC domain-containing protein n=1 Tax=Arthrobacter oryzae TaxID=409290 RepID=UPI002789320D|nr:PspC domain-containing protein [Arthrobacter oryzae]MDQ0074938.1 phage shock protein PspC (stress-responsive transcriptional regulator) [Arthrobacter oryzae]